MSKMCKALEDMITDARDEGISKGYNAGIDEGRNEATNEGMLNVVATVRDLNFGKDVAIQQLAKRYTLSQDDAMSFVNQNWWLVMSKMCKAIEDMLTDARNEGRNIAINEGRLNIIAMLRELNFSKDVAVQELSKRYNMPLEEAASFVDNNWWIILKESGAPNLRLVRGIAFLWCYILLCSRM